MPVIFAIYLLVYNINIKSEGIKCYVIFFSIIHRGHLPDVSHLMTYFICVALLSIINIFLVYLSSRGSGSKSYYLNSSSRRVVASSLNTSGGFKYIVNRYYSTSNRPGDSNSKSVAKRKTLTSPKSRAYVDLHAGRGIPNNEPRPHPEDGVWVKDNGRERSPFGASWAKDEKNKLPLPSNYPCNYVNISDPFNNRELIKEYCKGNRVVYIWTYLPTGICLVGSSSNSVERVLSYFEKKYLFLDTRRGVQFLADYGFKNIQLTIIYFAYHKFTTRDIKINDAYYINELNNSLNSQKYVAKGMIKI